MINLKKEVWKYIEVCELKFSSFLYIVSLILLSLVEVLSIWVIFPILTVLMDDDYYISGDYILLYWSFENLIKNSIESIKNDIGIINIEVEKIDNEIRITFSDNGIGIINKDKNKIFKPGYSTKSRGWGLGLSLSKRIINDIHQGTIKLLKSTKEGTSFLITFKSSYS